MKIGIIIAIILLLVASFWYVYREKKEQKSQRLFAAKMKADNLAEGINKRLQVCPQCGMQHKITIKPKIIKGRVVYRVLMLDDTPTIDNCDEIKHRIYYNVYWLEKEMNDYDGFNRYTW